MPCTMEEELIHLKSTLKSLVVSSATTVDVNTLLRDYRALLGGPLPLAKFGYRDTIKFLMERCNDCFLFQGSPTNPILTLIVPDNLKHIDQFVRKQRVTSNAKYKGKRRSVTGFTPIQPAPVIKPLLTLPFNNYPPRNGAAIGNGTQSGMGTPTWNGTQNKNGPINRSDLQTRYPNQIRNGVVNGQAPQMKNYTQIRNETEVRYDSQIRNNNQIRYDNQITNDTQIKNDTQTRNAFQNRQETHNRIEMSHKHDTVNKHIIPINKDTVHSSDPKVPVSQEDLHSSEEESGPSGALGKFYKKRLPQYNSNDFPAMQDSKDDAGSGKRSSSSQSSTSKQARLDELKAEIFAVIQDSAEGIWCTDLMRLYRERYGRELTFNRFGHTSSISLVYGMQDLVHITRPTASGDWLLQDAGRVRRDAAAAGRGRGRAPPRRTDAPRPRSRRRLPDDAAAEDALPGVDFEPDVFPSDCLHYTEIVPPQSLADLERGAMVEVVVGEVYSPSHFWLIRVGENYNLAMEAVMDEMTEYYKRGGGATRWLARGAVRVGQYCASEYDADWHRSLIVHLIDSDTVKVRHVDYGTVDAVSVSALKPLRREWAALARQGVRARLAGARPAAAGRRWPRAACAAFLDEVRNKRLYANVRAVDREEDILETYLIDTSHAEDRCVTRELVRAGHADERPDSALGSDETYLYPRFSALENGDTPNYAEIARYLRDGIALECVDAYRRHVPAALPPPPPPAPPAPALDLVDRVPLLRLDDVPPAPSVPPGPPEVRLSEAEWSVLAHLRAEDPAAAHWYLLSFAWRAALASSPPPGF